MQRFVAQCQRFRRTVLPRPASRSSGAHAAGVERPQNMSFVTESGIVEFAPQQMRMGVAVKHSVFLQAVRWYRQASGAGRQMVV